MLYDFLCSGESFWFEISLRVFYYIFLNTLISIVAIGKEILCKIRCIPQEIKIKALD